MTSSLKPIFHHRSSSSGNIKENHRSLSSSAISFASYVFVTASLKLKIPLKQIPLEIKIGARSFIIESKIYSVKFTRSVRRPFTLRSQRLDIFAEKLINWIIRGNCLSLEGCPDDALQKTARLSLPLPFCFQHVEDLRVQQLRTRRNAAGEVVHHN